MLRRHINCRIIIIIYSYRSSPIAGKMKVNDKETPQSADQSAKQNHLFLTTARAHGSINLT